MKIREGILVFLGNWHPLIPKKERLPDHEVPKNLLDIIDMPKNANGEFFLRRQLLKRDLKIPAGIGEGQEQISVQYILSPYRKRSGF